MDIIIVVVGACIAVLGPIALLLAIGGRTLNQQWPTYPTVAKKQAITIWNSILAGSLGYFVYGFLALTGV